MEQNFESEECKIITDTKKGLYVLSSKPATNVSLQLNWKSVKRVSKLRYLGRIQMNKDDDIETVESN